METRAGACRERGRGRAGCLFLLLTVVCMFFISLSVIPVYLDKRDFEEEVRSVARQAAFENWADERIVESVRKLASTRRFAVAEDDVRIIHSGIADIAPEVRILVTFSRNVGPPGFVHRMRFGLDVSSRTEDS